MLLILPVDKKFIPIDKMANDIDKILCQIIFEKNPNDRIYANGVIGKVRIPKKYILISQDKRSIIERYNKKLLKLFIETAPL